MSNTLRVVVVSLVAGLLLAGSAQATTDDFQTLVGGSADLMHQWSFEGVEATAVLDSVGGNDLTPFVAGGDHTTDPTHIQYNVVGFDATSTAASTFNEQGDGNFGGGHGDAFHTSGAIAPPETFSWEVVLKTEYAPIVSDPDDKYNLGYVIAHRVSGGPRGYFLWQGSSFDVDTLNGGDSFTSLTGAWQTGEETIVPAVIAENNWYYMAGTYTVNAGAGTSQVELYYADLTGGDVALTHTSFANTGAYDYGTAGIFGIGARYDSNGETFPGVLDELNLYSAALTQTQLQANLDALLVPEPATMSVLLVGGLGLIARRRRK